MQQSISSHFIWQLALILTHAEVLSWSEVSPSGPPKQRRICLTCTATLSPHLMSRLISPISLSLLCLPLDPQCKTPPGSASGRGPCCFKTRLHFPCKSPAKLYPQPLPSKLGKSLRQSSVELTWMTGGLNYYLSAAFLMPSLPCLENRL